MTYEEAKSLIKNLIAVMNDGGLEWERRADLVMMRFIELNMLKVEKPAQSPTLWELLRYNGVDFTKAQQICNAAMIQGVQLPHSPQDTTAND